MDTLMLARRASVRDRSLRSSGLVVLLGLLLVLAFIPSAAPVAAQERGPRLLHLPMRWCVLEGTVAARQNPDGAVLERIRRASSILAPKAGITLRSAVNRSLGDTLGFPVIKDPRRKPGRPGDVRTPVESLAEYHLVVTACERAWQRMERAAGKQASFGGLAKGPVGVIIGDFVDATGRPVSNVWGYAMSASSNSDYCLSSAPVRWASGGSLMVVDARDGHPSQLLDRRLVAHEIGHILRLGHGDGLDNPGSVRGRIDKWCDATENPDIPGSLMTYTLSYENLEPWQQRLTRNVVSRHPAGVGSMPFFQPRQKQERVKQLQRIANGGRRIVRRLVPPTRPPLRSLPRLWSAGTWGDDYVDLPNDVRAKAGKMAPKAVDLNRITISADVQTGDLAIALSPRLVPVAGEQMAGFVVDTDADPTTGGSPASIPDLPLKKLAQAVGVELVGIITLVVGEPTTQAWRWDAETKVWVEMVPPPAMDLNGFIEEEEHAPDDEDRGPGAKVALPTPDTMILTIPEWLIEPAVDLRVGAVLRTTTPDGRTYVDTIPAKPAEGLVSMSTREVDYPVCAVNRDTDTPGTAKLGEPITLEVEGFGRDGRVAVWLGDGDRPIGRLDYWDPPCDWAWVGEVTLPEELPSPDGAEASPVPGADGTEEADGSADGLYMLQVVLEGTGLTADCPLIIGDPELPEWFTEVAPA